MSKYINLLSRSIMQKRIFPFLILICLSLFSIKVMALTCGDDISQNIVSANNYIFQIVDYIDSPAKGIKQEVRTTTTTLANNVPNSTVIQKLEYDRYGQIIKSKYDIYSGDNKKLYSENLRKNNLGWENFIEDVEDKTTSLIQFKTDTQGKIIESQQAKRSVDFVFVETDTYNYNDNNCLINKNVQWQLKEIDTHGKFTGTNQKGSSTYNFEYQNNQLARVLYNFSNNTKNESTFLYHYDENKQLTAIHSVNLFGNNDKTEYITQFLTFNDKHDWLTANRVRANQENKHINIVRELTYY